MSKYEQAVIRYYKAVKAKKERKNTYDEYIARFDVYENRGTYRETCHNTLRQDYNTAKEIRKEVNSDGYMLLADVIINIVEDDDLINLQQDLEALINLRQERGEINKEIGYAKSAIYRIGKSLIE